jgi:hypothetical protein
MLTTLCYVALKKIASISEARKEKLAQRLVALGETDLLKSELVWDYVYLKDRLEAISSGEKTDLLKSEYKLDEDGCLVIPMQKFENPDKFFNSEGLDKYKKQCIFEFNKISKEIGKKYGLSNSYVDGESIRFLLDIYDVRKHIQ